MPDQPIQEQFGQRVLSTLASVAGEQALRFGTDMIAAFADFAREDIRTPTELSNHEFRHIADNELREALSQVLYGTRWIYKLGLALLVTKEERAAHVRAQIVDYASICEAILSYCNARAIDRGYVRGESYRWRDPDKRKQSLVWTPGSVSTSPVFRKLPLWWQARVACETGILNDKLTSQLDWLRTERNAVHIRERVALGKDAYLAHSKQAFEIMTELNRQTKLWCASHRN